MGILALALAAAGVPASAGGPAEIFVAFMRQNCTVPGYTADQRADALSEWRAVEGNEREFIGDYLARAMALAGTLRGQFPMGEAEETAAAFRQSIDARLDETDPARPQARLLIHGDNGYLALLLEAAPNPRVDTVACRLMMRAPNPDLVDDLIVRFSVLPELRQDRLRLWTSGTLRDRPGARTDHSRQLSLHLTEDGGTEVAILEFSTVTVAK